MNDPASLVALSASGLAAIALASAAGLRGWAGWLELRRLEQERRRAGSPAPGAAREVAELRARVRRLEAIADGAQV